MIKEIITVLESLQNGIKAIDRLAYALEQQNEIALAHIAAARRPITGAVVADQIEAMVEVATQTVAAALPEPETVEAPEPAPKPGKVRPTKAEMMVKREAAKEAVLSAGLQLDHIEADLKTLWSGWSSAQCEAAELQAAQAGEQAAQAGEQAETMAAQPEPQPEPEPIEEPTLTEQPARAIDAGAVRAAVVAYSNAHGKPAARELIQRIGGAEKLTDVPAENLSALYQAVTQAAA